MKARIVAFKVFHLHFLNRLNYRRRNQMNAVVYTAELLDRIKKQRSTRTEQVRSLRRNYCAVLQLNSCGRHACVERALFGGNCYAAVVCGYFGLIHQKLKLIDF